MIARAAGDMFKIRIRQYICDITVAINRLALMVTSAVRKVTLEDGIVGKEADWNNYIGPKIVKRQNRVSVSMEPRGTLAFA